MQIESPASTAIANETTIADELADFSTNRRMLLLSAMALVIGAISSFVAWALIWLIAAITNLAFYHRFSAAPVVPQAATAFPKHWKPFCWVAAVFRPRWRFSNHFLPPSPSALAVRSELKGRSS
jgi:hypothetical protein